MAASTTQGTHQASPSSPAPRLAHLHLTQLGADDLPPHPDLLSAQSTPPSPRDFINRVFTEAQLVVDIPSYNFKKEYDFGVQYPKIKTYFKKFADKTWCARLSNHAQGPDVQYTHADFDDFVNGLKKEHSKHEREYSEELFDVNKMLTWDSAELSEAGREFGFEDITMEINEIFFRMSWPLHHRVFTVAVLTAKVVDSAIFYVIQLPVSPSLFSSAGLAHLSHSGAKYVNSHPLGDQKALVGKKLVPGVYCSVERVAQSGADESPVCSWMMATVSDAGGVLPQCLQKPFVPGKIAKDVPYFLDWLQKKQYLSVRSLGM